MSSYLDTIYEEASKEFELPIEDIKFIYESMFGSIHDTISDMPFSSKDKYLNEEEFEAIQRNFNVPSIGKFHAPYGLYVSRKRRYQKYLNRKKK
jgi:hypothetical protein